MPVSLQLDKALRDFLAQMRSPSPEANHGDPTEPDLESRPSVKSPLKQPVTAAAVPNRAGQSKSEASRDRGSSQNPSNLFPASPAALSVEQQLGVVTSASASNRQPTDRSAELPAVATKGQYSSQSLSAAPASAEAAKPDVVSTKLAESGREATQQTSSATTSSSPVKLQGVYTDERSTQTPRAHASPRVLRCAPPGRDSHRPSAIQANLLDGFPPGLDRQNPTHSRAGTFLSGWPSHSADHPDPFSSPIPVSPAIYNPGSTANQEIHMTHGPIASQQYAVSQEQLPQHVLRHLGASEQLLTQLASQALAQQGHASSHSEVSTGSTLSPFAEAAHDRAADAAHMPSMPQSAPLVTSLADIAGGSDSQAAAVLPAQQQEAGSATSQNASSSAAFAVSSMQQQQHHFSAGSAAQPSAPFFRVSSLPLQAPQFPIAEGPQHRPSPNRSGIRDPYYGYSQASFLPFGLARVDREDAWQIATSQDDEFARVNLGHQATPGMHQIPRHMHDGNKSCFWAF